MTRFF